MSVSDAHERRGRRSPLAVDVGVVVAVGLVMMLTISVAREAGATRTPDVLAYLLGLTVAALLLVRRQWPMGVLVASNGVLLFYYALEYPAFSPALALAAATYFAAAAGHMRAAATVLTGLTLFAVGWRTLGEHSSLLAVLGTDTLADSALLAVVLLLGEAVRNRRAWLLEVRARLQRADQDRQAEAQRRVEQERLRIAHELHDVMAHTITAVSVQAEVAADALPDAPDQAEVALRTIRQQSREAMAELRAAVGLLRADAPRTPTPGLHGLEDLVQTAGRSGLQIDLSIAGAVRPLSGAVDLTAYRIVQESLTNIVRHAHTATGSVLVRYEPGAVVVEIADDGRVTSGAPPGPNGLARAGHGLVGMRERAAAIGGTLTAGHQPEGGFRVAAHLPAAQGGT